MQRVLSRLMAYSIFEERSLCLEVLQQAGHCSPAVAYQGVQNIVHFIAGLTRTNANGTPNSKEQSPVEVLLHSNGHLGAKHLGVQDYATVHSMCAGANINSQCMRMSDMRSAAVLARCVHLF